MKQQSQVIFERNTVEFVTVAAEYCAFIERSEGQKRAEFVDTLLKILPLLYIKQLLSGVAAFISRKYSDIRTEQIIEYATQGRFIFLRQDAPLGRGYEGRRASSNRRRRSRSRTREG